MDISSLGITGVAAITVICLLIGQAVKATRLDNKSCPSSAGCWEEGVSRSPAPCRTSAGCGTRRPMRSGALPGGFKRSGTSCWKSL